jgi:hypothetical protein
MKSTNLGTAMMVAAVLMLPGCDYMPFGYTPIRDIVTAPAQFEGKEVKLKGRVKSTVKLLGVQVYKLQDETGEITVSTNALPAENSEVAVKGIVKSAVIVGGEALGLRLDETQRLR